MDRAAAERDDETAAIAGSRQRVDLGDVFTILLSRWVLIAASVAAAVAIGLVYLAMTPRLYTGVASILIDTRNRSSVDTGLALNGFPDTILVESQVRVISSDLVLRRAVAAEKLDRDPEFAPTGGGLRSRLMTAIGFGGSAPATAEDAEAQAAGTLASRVVVKRSERTYVADIEVTAQEPAKAARLANAVARAYLADQQAARVEAADRDSGWVLGQISDMQAGLREAELRVEAYKRDHGIIDANGKLLNEQELAEATTGVLAARTKAAEAKARFDQINRVIASGRNLDTLPDALKSPMIDRLRGQYAEISRQQATLRETLGSRHPALLESDQQMRDVQRLIAEELKRIETGVANEYQTAQANAAALEKQVQGLRTTTVSSKADRVRLDELQRDVDARRTVYDRFLRARDTVKEQASDTPIGRIIAPAITPTSASSPKRIAVLLLALVSGLLVGCGAALLLDRLPPLRKRRVAPVAPAQLTESPEDLPLTPVLGMLPATFGGVGARDGRTRLLERARAAWPTNGSAGSRVPPSSAFMAAVAGLARTLDERGGQRRAVSTFLVTSAHADDARSLFVMALAEAAAQDGRRVLVIDAGRARTLLRDLVATGPQTNLIDMMGTTRPCQPITAAWPGSVSVVPKLADEARLMQRLLGRKTTQHIDGIRGNFDLVIFDGPPADEPELLRTLLPLAPHVVYAAPLDLGPADLDRAVAELAAPAESSVVAVFLTDLPSPQTASAAA